jgi:hypothetical protein
MAGAWSLSEAFRKAQLIRQKEDESRFECDLLLAESPDLRTVATIDLQTKPFLALRALDMSMLKSVPETEGEERPVFRFVYHVAEWRKYGNLVLPALAFRDAYVHEHDAPKMENGKPVIACMVFKRVSARDRRDDPPPAETFTMPIEEGDWVSDERMNVSYTVGENLIVVDGFIYEVAGHVGPDAAMHLPELLAAAEDRMPVPVSEVVDRATSRSFLSTPFGAVAAGAVTFVLVLAVLSIRPASLLRRTT